MSPLKRFVLDVAKAPDLLNHVLVPAVLGNSIWSLGQILLPMMRDPDRATAPWAEIAIVFTIISYLLVLFVSESAGKYRVDRSPPVMIAISSVEHFVQCAALAVAVIALSPRPSIRTASAALLVYSVALTVGHGVKSIYEVRQVRIDSRLVIGGMAMLLIAACLHGVFRPTRSSLEILAWVFAGTFVVYLVVPWKHDRWRVPRYLSESTRSDELLTLRYRNRARRLTTVTVLAYDPRRLDDRVYVELPLDEKGIGHKQIPWPGDAVVVLDYEDSYPRTLRPERS